MQKRFFVFLALITLSVILKPYRSLAEQNVDPQNGTKREQATEPARKFSDTRSENPHRSFNRVNNSPITVNLLPVPKTKQEIAQEEQSRKDQSSANWWMVGLTAVISLIGFLQLIVFGRQASRLRETINTMKEIAQGQTNDMQASIKEATRASAAMEGIAIAMAANVQSVQQSVKITREIADRQKLISELQSRAYLSVQFSEMVPQNTQTGIRFEPRVLLVNRGNTPASNVKFRSMADVVQFPPPEDFPFFLPEYSPHGSVSIIAPGMNKILQAVVPNTYAEEDVVAIKIGVSKRVLMWGMVTYEDVFGIERFVKFALTFFWLNEQNIMSQDTRRYNDSN